MRTVTLEGSGGLLIPRCKVAETFIPRAAGLMFRKGIPREEAILFPNCTSIHTCFMRFPIDVLFTNAQGLVVDVVGKLPPWRVLWPRREARHVVEMAAGRCAELDISQGSVLRCEGVFV